MLGLSFYIACREGIEVFDRFDIRRFDKERLIVECQTLDIEEIVEFGEFIWFTCVVDIKNLAVKFLGRKIDDGPIKFSECPFL